MQAIVQTREQLETTVGKLPGPRDAKVIDHLDDGARRWMARSPLALLALQASDGPQVTVAGGAPGFAYGVPSTGDVARLVLPRDCIDDPDRPAVGAGIGTLFLVPGLRETLRVNGTVESVTDNLVTVRVVECYMHCAKAFIRSSFWDATPFSSDSPPAATDLLATTRFLALATTDAEGQADLSPKGDPAGLLVQMEHGEVLFADRPGNRRTDSFRNILEQPRIALAAWVPGSATLAVVRGTAVLSRDEALRARFQVDGKTPALVVRVAPTETTARDSAAVRRARLWPAAPAPDDLDPAALFAGHVRATRERGASMLLVKALVSVPGLMRKGLERDYRDNLY